jgi:hypothetical protein
MARYQVTAESSTALVATAPSGSTANALFAALVAGASQGCKLRRVTLGVRAGTGAPTSQQVTVGVVRTTARGTATSTTTMNAIDPNTASQITGLDVAWSTVPTATWTAPYLWEGTFNTQSGLDLPWELLEEWVITKGTANGLAFINVGNALPTSHLYTLSIEEEELRVTSGVTRRPRKPRGPAGISANSRQWQPALSRFCRETTGGAHGRHLHHRAPDHRAVGRH